MELIVKHFDELTTKELHAIYALRVAIFIVEQNCPYKEVDDADLVAYHIYLKDETGIKAYMRVLPKGATFQEVSLGRVISLKRRCGLASKLLKIGIDVAKEKYGADKIVIEAQTYVKTLYENVGFKIISDEFLEDGIPHVKMMLEI